MKTIESSVATARGGLGALGLIGGLALICAAGCNDSNGPQSTSASNWLACQELADCAAFTDAVACVDGYCVDATGQRIEREDGKGSANDGSTARGGDGGDEDDSSSSDAGQDSGATSDDASVSEISQALKVTVTRADGTPLPGLKLYLHAADGSTLSTLTTDAAGKAASDQTAPVVTLDLTGLQEPANFWSRRLISWFGVKQGDHLQVLAGTNEYVGPQTVYTATFAEPTSEYYINGGPTGCDMRNINYDQNVTDWELDCVPAPTNSLLAYREDRMGDDDPSNNLSYYSWVNDAPLGSNGQPTHVMFPAWTLATSTQVRFVNLPLDLEDQHVWSNLAMWRGTSQAWGSADWTDNLPYTPLIWEEFFYAPGFADDIETESTVDYKNVQHTFYRREAPGPTQITFDYGKRLRPPSNPKTVISGSPQRARLSWDASPDAAKLDFAMTNLTIALVMPDPATYAYGGTWTIIAPGADTSFVLPDLLQSHGLDLSQVMAFEIDGVNHVASDGLADYQAFKVRPLRTDELQNPKLDAHVGKRGESQLISWNRPPAN
ncbi:MAG: hypothetical protein QM778_03440 [Myxococcales bacterium]